MFVLSFTQCHYNIMFNCQNRTHIIIKNTEAKHNFFSVVFFYSVMTKRLLNLTSKFRLDSINFLEHHTCFTIYSIYNRNFP